MDGKQPLWAVALGLAATVLSPSAPRAAEPPVAPPLRSTGAQATGSQSSRPIAQLIADLNHDSYPVREQATRDLILRGAPAIPAVARAAQSDSLEMATRAVGVLRYLGMSPDADIEDAVIGELKKISATPNSAVALRATDAVGYLTETRAARAIARLKELGGVVSPPYSIGGRGGGGRIIAGGGLFVVGPGGVIVDDSNESRFAFTIGPDWKGGRAGLKHLGRTEEVTQLVLEGDQVGDEWLQDLAAMPLAADLQSLTLRRTKITAASVPHLAKFTELVELDLFHAPVADDAVDHLAKLKKLQSIRLYGTRVTGDGAAVLEKKLGGQGKVDRRGGALLGVSGSPSEEGCLLHFVTENSAAAKAGIRPADVIVEFDRRPVANFTELTAAIADKSGGDTVRIKLLRDGAPQTVTVTLGEW